jgi:hypothetical protein
VTACDWNIVVALIEQTGYANCQMTFRKFSLAFVLLCCTSYLLGQNEKNDPEVAPGISLPTSGTIFGLDLVHQKATLLQIHPTEIVSNSHAGSNFARSQVFAGPHSTVELTGISSAATFHITQAVLYVRLSGDDAELMRNRIKLIRLKQAKDRRIVSDFSMNIFGGQRKRQYDEVPVAKSDIADTTWLKLTPQSPLEPGEYGIVFMPKDANLFADAVYDFSIVGDPAPKAKR